MIITKKRLNLTPGFKGKWPFNVPEVTILMLRFDNEWCFAVIHDFGAYALSGILENHGFDSLEESGIWADHPDLPGGDGRKPVKKSLTSVFDYITFLLENSKPNSK